MDRVDSTFCYEVCYAPLKDYEYVSSYIDCSYHVWRL